MISTVSVYYSMTHHQIRWSARCHPKLELQRAGGEHPQLLVMAEKRRLLLLSGGVIVLHTLVTILEEALFAQPVFRAKAGSTFMTLTFYVVAAGAYAPRGGGGSGSKQPRPSRRLVAMIAASAALYVTTTTLSKTALTYIDLPTQVSAVYK